MKLAAIFLAVAVIAIVFLRREREEWLAPMEPEPGGWGWD